MVAVIDAGLSYHCSKDDFVLVINKISTCPALTSEIIRLQDKFTKNNVNYLIHVTSEIAKVIRIYVPHVPDSAAIEVAEYLSGLYSYKQREKLAIIKLKLPHFSKWFAGALSNNCVLHAFHVNDKIDSALDNLIDEYVSVNGKLDVGKLSADTDFGTATDALLRFKEIHSKKNDIVASISKKFWGVDEIDDVRDTMASYRGGRRGQSEGD